MEGVFSTADALYDLVALESDTHVQHHHGIAYGRAGLMKLASNATAQVMQAIRMQWEVFVRFEAQSAVMDAASSSGVMPSQDSALPSLLDLHDEFHRINCSSTRLMYSPLQLGHMLNFTRRDALVAEPRLWRAWQASGCIPPESPWLIGARLKLQVIAGLVLDGTIETINRFADVAVDMPRLLPRNLVVQEMRSFSRNARAVLQSPLSDFIDDNMQVVSTGIRTATGALRDSQGTAPALDAVARVVHTRAAALHGDLLSRSQSI